MSWPTIGLTLYHVQLGFQDKIPAIKYLVVGIKSRNSSFNKTLLPLVS